MGWKERIDRFYKNNLWTLDQVKLAVVNGKITELEYKEITGRDYVPQVV